MQGKKVVRLLFRQMTAAAGLLENKRCKMIIDKRCVMCECGAGEDVEHLLVMCGEFERDQWELLDEVSRIVWAAEWLEEYGRVCKESKVALLLGKVWRE